MTESTTVFDAFEHTARARPANSFLHVPASALPGATAAFELAYGTALTEVAKLAERYRVRGYGVGHRVAVLLGNRPELLLHYLALNACGASMVLLNTMRRIPGSRSSLFSNALSTRDI